MTLETPTPPNAPNGAASPDATAGAGTAAVSYNSESSEYVSAQPVIYELLARISTQIEDGRMRVTGRSMVRADAVLGLIEDLKRELPKVTSLSDQIVTKRDQMLTDAEDFMQKARHDSMREAQAIRTRAEEERDIILAQARKKAMEMIDQTAVVIGAKEESERIKKEASADAEAILIRAKREANTIVDDAREIYGKRTDEVEEYTKMMLMKLEEHLSHSLMQVRQGIDVVNENVETRKRQSANNMANNAAKYNPHNRANR